MIKFAIFICTHTLRKTMFFTIIQYYERSKLYVPSQVNESQYMFFHKE